MSLRFVPVVNLRVPSLQRHLHLICGAPSFSVEIVFFLFVVFAACFGTKIRVSLGTKDFHQRLSQYFMFACGVSKSIRPSSSLCVAARNKHIPVCLRFRTSVYVQKVGLFRREIAPALGSQGQDIWCEPQNDKTFGVVLE